VQGTVGEVENSTNILSIQYLTCDFDVKGTLSRDNLDKLS
jgi:hypothetical protein